jgi:hypothetical protein
MSGLAALFLYPSKGRASYHRKRGLFDKILIITGFLSFACIGNTMHKTSQAGNVYSAYIERGFDQAYDGISETTGDDPDNTLTRVLLSLLTSCVGLILIVLIASLACNFACSGMETVATILFLAGAVIIITFAVMAMQEIWRKKEPEPQKS